LPSANQIKDNKTYIIVRLEDSNIKEKLMEMGCTPGTPVRRLHSAPFGCPITFDINGYQLALRAEEASTLILE